MGQNAPAAGETKSLSSSDSKLGLGTWNFGDPYWSDFGDKEKSPASGRPAPAQELSPEKIRNLKGRLEAAFAGGIRHFDTAPVYAAGRAELLLGQALRKNRGLVSLSSKFYPTLAENVSKGLEKTLRRLNTNWLDTYYVHWPNPNYPMGKIVTELEKARSRGLIKNIGVSNFNLAELKEAENWGKIDCCQGPYSLLWRFPEKELLPYCRSRGIGFAAYSPLSQGILAADSGGSSGRVTEYPDGRQSLIYYKPELRPALEKFIRSFGEIVRPLSLTSAQTALAWLFSKPDVFLVFTGAGNTVQLKELLAVPGQTLPQNAGTDLDEISGDFFLTLESRFPDLEDPWAHKKRRKKYE